ncbi:MAG: phosphate acyltransferase PlsX [Flavobacteriales bacterium]|nr:phosphate acyltransferase PlsX [Flavobacteriales bacterium]
MKIGLDIMGGDFAPDTTVSGALLAREELSSDVQLVLIGDEAEIKSRLKDHDESAFEIVHAEESVGMAESPTKALVQKKNSGIAIGFRMLGSGEIDGFASTGNSGAMLVGSMRSVGAIPGIYRPCVVTPLPKMNGSVTILLDVGINADCKPDVLYQFAILGSIYAERVYNIKKPRVGLLNIGEEESKGNLLTQATHAMMKGTSDFNFTGNVEGRDLFNDDIDVIVCDGFTGNVVLKEVEAFYSIIKKRGISDEYLDQFNYENYGGTPFLGINAPVVIGHGASSDLAVKNMIILTKEIIEAKISDKIKEVFT